MTLVGTQTFNAWHYSHFRDCHIIFKIISLFESGPPEGPPLYLTDLSLLIYWFSFPLFFLFVDETALFDL